MAPVPTRLCPHGLMRPGHPGTGLRRRVRSRHSGSRPGKLPSPVQPGPPPPSGGTTVPGEGGGEAAIRIGYWNQVPLGVLGSEVGPVLKHGPRSARCMQGEGILIPTYRNEHDRRGLREFKQGLSAGRHCPPVHPAWQFLATRPRVATVKYAACHPKASELCLCRVKPGETPVEARSGSDVQIDRRTRA